MDTAQVASRRSDILAAFEGFREELDEHNDRRERIIKTNRDITNLSKKLIFQLHRIAQDENTDEGRSKAIHKSGSKFAEVQKLYAKLQADVEGERNSRYARSMSGGVQELIEALSLRHYLLNGEMISHAGVQQFLTSVDGEKYMDLPDSDYLLGVSDLTGEIMRLAISTITRSGGRDRALHTADFVRRCMADFETFTPHVRDLQKKQKETTASLRKIEDALYAIRVREFEHSEGSFDEVISRFAYNFEKPRDPLDDDGDMLDKMSDDEYFGDDDIFNSAELDYIPLLNEPPAAVVNVSIAPVVEQPPTRAPDPPAASTSAGTSGGVNSVATEPPQPSSRHGTSQQNSTGSTHDSAQASGSRSSTSNQATPLRRTGSRLSTIMNALRTGQNGEGSTQAARAPYGVFGPPTGLLQTPQRHAQKEGSSSSATFHGPPRKVTCPSPQLGSKRRRSSSSSRNADTLVVAQAAREDTWGVVEEELNCVICCDVLVAPQITTCGHTVCAKQQLPDLPMIDRLFLEASKNQLAEWCPGGVKRVEWEKRKREWDMSVAQAAADAARVNRVNTRSATRVVQPRQYPPPLLFLPPDDEFDFDEYADRVYAYNERYADHPDYY